MVSQTVAEWCQDASAPIRAIAVCSDTQVRRRRVGANDSIQYKMHDLAFVSLAVFLDAWSRWVVGYAVSLQIDTRLTIAALRVALENRRPPPGCIHHTDRGSQHGSAAYRALMA